MPPKMSERVDALEERISALEGSAQNMFDEFRQTILAEFAKLMNRPMPETPEASSVKDSADEFKMAVKKVELPAFNGMDHACRNILLSTRYDGGSEGPFGKTEYGGNLHPLVQSLTRDRGQPDMVEIEASLD